MKMGLMIQCKLMTQNLSLKMKITCKSVKKKKKKRFFTACLREQQIKIQ